MMPPPLSAGPMESPALVMHYQNGPVFRRRRDPVYKHLPRYLVLARYRDEVRRICYPEQCGQMRGAPAIRMA